MSHHALHPDAEGLEPDSWDPKVDHDEGDAGTVEVLATLGVHHEYGLAEARAAHTAAPNPSGLSDDHRVKARDLACAAALLGYHNSDALHYTQRPRRWDGINLNLKAYQGEFPHFADCSAYVTWCLWNGLDHYGVRDVPNDYAWKAGYTGTLAVHGARASEWIMRGDYAIYGSAWPYGHTALCIGGGMVISHGSERGPLLLPMNYRSDLAMVRRSI